MSLVTSDVDGGPGVIGTGGAPFGSVSLKATHGLTATAAAEAAVVGGVVVGASDVEGLPEIVRCFGPSLLLAITRIRPTPTTKTAIATIALAQRMRRRC